MKIKNINLSLATLTVLVVLSFSFFVAAEENSSTKNNVFLDSDQDGLMDSEEKTYGTDPFQADSDKDGYSDGAEVKSGYDPLKPAPGDRIAPNEETAPSPEVLGENSEKNLTNEVAEKIAELATEADSENQALSLSDIQSIVDETINPTVTLDDFPEINQDNIKILEQNYSSLSEEKAKAKKKEDFMNYIAAISYILSSNSPKPITSTSDVASLFSQMSQQVILAMESRDASSLDDLNKSGEKIMEQLKEVEVPEDMVDIHIKLLSYARYAQEMRSYVNPLPDDPIQDIANFSKIQGFIESFFSFSTDIKAKLDEYGIEYDADMQDKLKSYGIEPIILEEATEDEQSPEDQ